MPAVVLSPILNGWQGLTLGGLPLSGGFINTYQAGTSTPQATYTTNAGSVANANPIVLGPDGRPPQEIWLIQGQAYRFTVTDSLSNLMATYDNITGVDDGAITLRSDLADTTNPAKGDALIGVKSVLTGGVSRTQHDKNADVISARDFGAKFDGSTDDTAAMLAGITAVYNQGGGTLELPPGTAMVSSVIFNWAAATTVNIVGAGESATVLQKITGTSTPVLDFSANIGVLDVYSTFRDFSINGVAKGSHGFRASRFARIETKRLKITTCDVGFEAVGCLIAIHDLADWNGNNIGYRSRKNTAGGNIYCNLVEFIGGAIRSNTTFGMDIGDASNVKIGSVDIETNGTAANTATGGVMIRDTVDDETGNSIINFDNTWFESNLGRTLQTEGPTHLYLTMRGVLILSPESNRSANIGAISNLTMIDCLAPSPGDTVVTAADNSFISGGLINTITDTGTSRIRLNVSTNAGLIKYGTSASGTAVLSGGVKAVSYPALKGNELVFLTSQADGGAAGFLRLTNKSGGVGFTVTSSSGTDTSTFAWFVVEAI